MSIDYDYVVISESMSGKQDELSSSSNATIRFAYTYGNGKWALSAMYINDFGLYDGAVSKTGSNQTRSGPKNPGTTGSNPADVSSTDQSPYDSAQDAPYNSQRIQLKRSGSVWTLEFEEWENNGWKTKLQVPAKVGRNGTSVSTREGDRKTPAGTHNVLFCFGTVRPETKLIFKRIARNDVFVDDASSPYYNTIVDNSQISAGTSHEKIYNQFTNGSYNTCVFFDFNGDGETAYSAVSGRGSVRTLRGKTGTLQGTLGDIDISSENMLTLLAYLDSAKHPVIIIE